MNSIFATSLHKVRRYRALWLYLLIFVVAITMALFSA